MLNPIDLVRRELRQLATAGGFFFGYFAVALAIGTGLFVVSAALAVPVWLLGLPMKYAGYGAAAVVGAAGFGTILYGGYRFIDW